MSPLVQLCILALLGAGCALRHQSPSKPDSDHFEHEVAEHSEHSKLSKPETSTEKQFASLDANSDGFITEREVALRQLHTAHGEQLASSRARNFVMCADLDHDGKVNSKEFAACAAQGLGHSKWESCMKEREDPSHAFFKFSDADANHDGALDSAELQMSFARSWGAPAQGLSGSFMACCDNNDDGKLVQHEFDTCGGHYNPATNSWAIVGQVQWKCLEPAFEQFDERLRFKIVDANGDDRISKQESYTFIDSMGGTMMHSDATRLFEEADTNKDGYLDSVEFLNAGKNHDARGKTTSPAYLLFGNLPVAGIEKHLVETAWDGAPIFDEGDASTLKKSK